MKFVVQLFGPYAKAMGSGEVSLDFGDASGAIAAATTAATTSTVAVTAAQVMAKLGEEYPAMGEMLAVAKLAVNCRYACPDQVVTADDELALIGMVGGG